MDSVGGFDFLYILVEELLILDGGRVSFKDVVFGGLVVLVVGFKFISVWVVNFGFDGLLKN